MEREPNLNQEIEMLKVQVGIITDSLFHIVDSLRTDESEKNCPEYIAMAQCLLQIVQCKMKSILLLSDGISIVPHNDEIKVLDIPSMIAIERSLFEMVFIFHNIFDMTDTEYEREILINTWEIRGFNNRQKITDISDKQKEKQLNEKHHINRLQQQVSEIMRKMNISEKAKREIEKATNSTSSMPKGYVFKKENGVIVSFEEKPFTASAKELFADKKVADAIYSLMSSHAHPSYLGVLQFGQMFKDSVYLQYLRTILKGVCFLSSFLVDDFCKNIRGGKSYFETLPEESKTILNAYISFKCTE